LQLQWILAVTDTSETSLLRMVPMSLIAAGFEFCRRRFSLSLLLHIFPVVVVVLLLLLLLQMISSLL